MRARRDARLCKPAAAEGHKRLYDPNKFTPDQIRQDTTIAWKRARIFHAGKWRSIRYKEVGPVLWQGGTQRLSLRLLVIAPTPYRKRKKARLYYRQPGYLLVTDLEAPVTTLLQAYFDRWQIEVNHKEEKDSLGVGEAQLRAKMSVPRKPAFMVAMYSALLFAAVFVYGDKRTDDCKPLTKWRRKAQRQSIDDLLDRLRLELSAQTPQGEPTTFESFLKLCAPRGNQSGNTVQT